MREADMCLRWRQERDSRLQTLGSTYTFRRPGYAQTIPDITLVSEEIAHRITEWRVIEDYTGSDHQYILFDISDRCSRPYQRNKRPKTWNCAKLDKDRFMSVINFREASNSIPQVSGSRDAAESSVKSTLSILKEACSVSMPVKHKQHRLRPVYWWTDEIAALRKRCLQCRRKAMRARTPEELSLRAEERRNVRRQLRRAINASKVGCWRQLCDEIDTDPWGRGYKIALKKFGAISPMASIDPLSMERIVSALFPVHKTRKEEIENVTEEEVPLFTQEELKTAVGSLRSGKAPGPDGIPVEALKVVAQEKPDFLLTMYNACLTAGVFSSNWKTARLVLIEKGKGGDRTAPSAYRPLCLLDTTGKLLEKLIQPRMLTSIEAAGDLSDRQYGFRKGRSTIGAIEEVTAALQRAEAGNNFSWSIVLLVTLDVKNAFNSAKWSDILEALKKTFTVPPYLMRMMHDYLKGRRITYTDSQGQRTRSMSAGAGQGSVLGPTLWNASYDRLLKTSMPEDTFLVCYADDVAAVITARDYELAQMKLNQVMRRVTSQMDKLGLNLAIQKTEIVTLTRKRIDTKSTAKYLGVTLDQKLTYWSHIKGSAEKAATMVTGLSRLMANTRGPTSSKRRLLMTAVNSVLLYGAELWADSLRLEKYRKRVAAVQRRAALRISCSYRTVAEPASLVIAGVIPIHLLAAERRRIYLRRSEAGPKGRLKKEERDATIASWQVLWEADTRSRWTATLIGDVQRWISRSHGEVGFYLTQFLTGHGFFRSYLHRMGKVTSPECPYCGAAEDDARHTFFECLRWHEERERHFQR